MSNQGSRRIIVGTAAVNKVALAAEQLDLVVRAVGEVPALSVQLLSKLEPSTQRGGLVTLVPVVRERETQKVAFAGRRR
jgi:hypothetical protein